MPVDLLWNRKRFVLIFACAFLTLFLPTGCAARLISVKSGSVLYSVSETGGDVFLPVSRAAELAVRSAVGDLQARLR